MNARSILHLPVVIRVLTGCAFFLFTSLLSLAQAPDSWVRMADMPPLAAARDRGMSFELNGLGYVGLGSDGVSTFYQSVWAYDPITDSWTQKASFTLLSGSRNRVFAFSLNGYGYMGTGWNGSTYLQGFFQYDPVANSWSQKGNYATARLGATAFVVNQRAFVVGGYNGVTVYNDTWEYDDVSNSWTQKANIPQSRYSCISFVLGNYGYVFTGYSGGFLNDNWRYDPANNSWLRRADLPATPRSLATAFAVGGSGFIYGGSSTGGMLGDLWEYSPFADKWFRRNAPPMGARFGSTAFVINDTAYVGTGNDNPNVYKDLWKYYPRQHTSARFQKNYGGTGDDTSVERTCNGDDTSDDGYIISSSSKSFTPSSDIYLLRLNAFGDTVWTRIYGTPAEDIASAVMQTADNGFVVAGMTGPSYLNADALMLKSNAAGQLLWNGNISGAGVQRLNCVIEDIYGDIVAGGRIDNAQQNAGIIKLSPAGGLLVNKMINHTPAGNTLEVYSIQDNGNGYLFGGEYLGGANNDGLLLFSDAAISSSLNMGNYGTASAEERSLAIQNYNNTLMLCGTSSIPSGHGARDIYLTKVGPAGVNVLWSKYYGGTGDDVAKAIVRTADGGYVIAGNTNSIGSGGLDIFLMKVDSLGSPVWTRTYGGSTDEKAGGLTVNYDGGFTIFGSTRSFSNGGNDVYCIRTDSLGFSGCQETSQNFLTPISGPNFSEVKRATNFTNTSIAGGPGLNVKPIPTAQNNICLSCTASAQSASTDALCFGSCTGTATITPTSSGNIFSYIWTPGSYTTSIVTGLCAGSYTVLVTDNNSCTASSTVTISEPAALQMVAPSDSLDICSGNADTIMIGATGGTAPYSYAWSPIAGLSCTTCPDPVASPTASTIYAVTISDSNSCSIVDSIYVNVHGAVSVTAGADQTICLGDSTAIGGPSIGGFGYSWSPPTGLNNASSSNPSANPVVTTTYIVTAINSLSCSATDTVIVNVAPSPTVNISASGSTVICSGDSITLTASGNAASYQWSSGQSTSSIVVSPSASTGYTVVASVGSCVDTGSISVTVVPSPVANITASSSGTVCAGTSITLSAPGPGSYLWNTGETTSSIVVNYTTAGNYINSVTVSASVSAGCSAQDSIAFNVVSSPAVNVTASSYTLCSGLATDTLIATNITGGNYNWSPGVHPNNDTIVVGPGLTPGVHIYTVSVNNGSGCSGVSTVTINVSPALPVPAVSPSPANACFGEPVPTFTCTNASALVGWADLQGNALGLGATFTPSVTATGSYTFLCVQAIDKNCISNPAAAILNIHALPVADAGVDQSICPGHTAQLNASGGSSYVWTPDQTLSSGSVSNPSANPDSTTGYQVTVIDVNGCKGTDSVNVFIVVSDDCGIHVYNVVTPNQDGDNDSWWIDGIASFPENTVKIFNRWGNIVWSAKGYDNTMVVWYGQSEQGDLLPAGTYYYMITINGKTYTDFVELIR